MSESMVCCPLSGSDDAEPAKVFSRAIVKAAKDHNCSECGEVITKGTRHEYVRGLWDSTWDDYRTCPSCVEIRDHFACNGYIYGQLWEDIEQNFFPDMKAGGPCMDGLSPAAKARLFELRDEWLTDNADRVDHVVYQGPP